MATNHENFQFMDFSDSSSALYAECTVVMPSDWGASGSFTITATFYWTANSATANSVFWQCQGRAYADNDALDATWGTLQSVTDANGSSANTARISAATSAITIAGSPAASQLVQLRVGRDSSQGGDNLAATARLIGVMIGFTR